MRTRCPGGREVFCEVSADTEQHLELVRSGAAVVVGDPRQGGVNEWLVVRRDRRVAS